MQSSSQPELKEFSRDAKAAAMRAFFNVAEKWNLNNTQMRVLLGQPSEPTFYNWKRGEVKNVPYDTINRISYILGIFKALQYIYIRPAHADEWVNKPNLTFGGASAMDRMLGGNITDLAAVRSYLDVVRGGH